MDESKSIQGSLPIDGEGAKSPMRDTVAIPSLLRDQLQEVAARAMPEFSWEEVLVLAMATGLGALNGMRSVIPAPVQTAEQVSDAVLPPPRVGPWPELMCRAILERIARVGEPLTMNLLEVAEIMPEVSCNLSNRNIGFKLASMARTGSAFGLRIENLGRGPGQPLHQYRFSAVDD